jgi:hypothetical protein
MDYFSTHTFGKTTFTVSKDTRLDRLLTDLHNEFPDLVFIHKRDSKWHWFLHVLICIFTLGFNRKYLSSMTTTSKNQVAFSDQKWEWLNGTNDYRHDRVWALLMHERVHLRQFRDRGSFMMALAYLHPPFLLWVPGRYNIEKPGYIETLRAQWELEPNLVRGKLKLADGTTYKTWWVHCFTGPSYGWMYRWGGRKVSEWYDKEVARLQIVNP